MRQKMFLTQSIACYLLPFLLFQPSFGLVLSRGKRQANIPPDSDYAGLRLRFADDGDYQDQAGYSESVSEQRGARGFLIPNFRKPLDRIFSEKRTIPRANQVPRRRISAPLDQIGGSRLTYRRVWLEYPDTERDFHDNGPSEPRTETDQQ